MLCTAYSSGLAQSLNKSDIHECLALISRGLDVEMTFSCRFHQRYQNKLKIDSLGFLVLENYTETYFLTRHWTWLLDAARQHILVKWYC